MSSNVIESEHEGIEISKETVRPWQKRRKGRKHRQWRERKSCLGEMLQMEGSHHDWFESRRPKCVLMVCIDDATSKVYDRFYEYEGTIPAMDSFLERVIQNLGATVIDDWRNYQLLEIIIIKRFKPRYLKMLNPSIGVWHVDGVPPYIQTCKEAFAWRDGEVSYITSDQIIR